MAAGVKLRSCGRLVYHLDRNVIDAAFTSIQNLLESVAES